MAITASKDCLNFNLSALASDNLFKPGKMIPKRKQWIPEQDKGPKRVKVEVKSTQTDSADSLIDGVSSEAYELMVKGMW